MSNNPYISPEVVPEDEVTNRFRPLTPFDRKLLQFYATHRHQRFSVLGPTLRLMAITVILVGLFVALLIMRPDDVRLVFFAGTLLGMFGMRLYFLLLSARAVPLFVRVLDYGRVEQVLAQNAYEPPEWDNA